MTPREAADFLHALPRWATSGERAYEPGLARIRALLDRMGRPQDRFETVHVAGTNGKGSTASMLAAIGTAIGERTGLHTSPHIRTLRERMRVDGEEAPAGWLAEAVARYRPAFEEVGPSFFEATLALSLRYFRDRGVDRAVVEVGMGGRLDATNVLEPTLCLITHVGLDHTEHLGETLEEIAREKAGIVEEGVPVLAGRMPAEAAAVIAAVARERGAPFRYVPDTGRPNLHVGLPGAHQWANALLAVRAAEQLYPSGERRSEAIARGLSEVAELAGLRARTELVQEEPAVIVDVAHNPESLERTVEAVVSPGASFLEEEGSLYVLLGLMADKDARGMAEVLKGRVAGVFPVELEGGRALSAAALRTVLARTSVPAAPAGGAATVEAALSWYGSEAGGEDALLCTGSHRVAGAVLDLLEPVRAGEEPSAS